MSPKKEDGVFICWRLHGSLREFIDLWDRRQACYQSFCPSQKPGGQGVTSKPKYDTAVFTYLVPLMACLISFFCNVCVCRPLPIHILWRWSWVHLGQFRKRSQNQEGINITHDSQPCRENACLDTEQVSITYQACPGCPCQHLQGICMAHTIIVFEHLLNVLIFTTTLPSGLHLKLQEIWPLWPVTVENVGKAFFMKTMYNFPLLIFILWPMRTEKGFISSLGQGNEQCCCRHVWVDWSELWRTVNIWMEFPMKDQRPDINF